MALKQTDVQRGRLEAIKADCWEKSKTRSWKIKRQTRKLRGRRQTGIGV